MNEMSNLDFVFESLWENEMLFDKTTDAKYDKWIGVVGESVELDGMLFDIIKGYQKNAFLKGIQLANEIALVKCKEAN